MGEMMQAYLERLTEACERYERTAPTVRDHCDDLYIRINDSASQVSLWELLRVERLWLGGWMSADYAANAIYKVREYLGLDTTGHVGF